MATLLTLQSYAQEIALQAAVGEILVERKGQLHQVRPSTV
jgi:hypothetical protein